MGHEVKVLCADSVLGGGIEDRGSASQDEVIRTAWARVNYPVDVLLGGPRRVAVRGYRVGGRSSAWLQHLGHVYQSLFNLPDGYVGWLPWACWEGAALLRRWRPDVILATAKPLSALLVGCILGKSFDVPWVAEMRDLWVDNHYYRFSGWRKSLERWLEHQVLSRAAGLVTISEPLAALLQARYSQPLAVIRHGIDPEDYPSEASGEGPPLRGAAGGVPEGPPLRGAAGGVPEGPPLRELSLLYTGMAYPGFQDPAPLFEAIRMLGPASGIRVRFYGRNLGWVEALVSQFGLAGCVEVLPAIAHADCLLEQRRADALLLLLWNDPEHRGVYTSKLFEYLGTRRPILAIGSSGNVAADLLLERGVGFVSQSADDIASKLREWIAVKAAGSALPPSPPGALAGLSRADQTALLEVFLRQFTPGDT